MRIIIDRFEENFAICEFTPDDYETDDIKIISIERSFLPINCRESDILVFLNCSWKIDKRQKEDVMDDISILESELFI